MKKYEKIMNFILCIFFSLLLLFYSIFEMNLLFSPCNKTIIERAFLIGTIIGFQLNVCYGPCSFNYGIIVASAMGGALVSLSQICKHVCPTFPIYSKQLCGLSFYSWELIIFSVILVTTASLLLIPKKQTNHTPYKFYEKFCLFISFIAILSSISSYIFSK